MLFIPALQGVVLSFKVINALSVQVHIPAEVIAPFTFFINGYTSVNRDSGSAGFAESADRANRAGAYFTLPKKTGPCPRRTGKG